MPTGSPSDSPPGIEIAGMPASDIGTVQDVREVHRQRVVGALAERRRRRVGEVGVTMQVDALEGGAEVVGDLRAHALRACRSRRRSSRTRARRCRA